FSSRRRHTRLQGDWSSDVCSSDLGQTVRTVRGLSADSPDSLSAPTMTESPTPTGVIPSRRYWHVAKLGLPERALLVSVAGPRRRSEERRVGKEWRSGWGRW